MSETIKPCPFCGGPAKAINRGHAWGVRCAGAVHFVHTYGATKAEAVADWNTRALPLPAAGGRDE